MADSERKKRFEKAVLRREPVPIERETLEYVCDNAVRLDVAPQRWEIHPEMDSAYAPFAGLCMTARTAADGQSGPYELRYQGFRKGGFESLDAARKAAPQFAREVLLHLVSLIKG